jgi:hypothetical protein
LTDYYTAQNDLWKGSTLKAGEIDKRFDKGEDISKYLDMAKAKKNAKRENRIVMEIIVDAYGPEEQAMGWYYYLEDKLGFPFLAVCATERATSPLRKGDEVEIVGMADEEECRHEMFVETSWKGRTLAIPLSHVEPIAGADEDTREAIEDWHYWVKQGYML